MLVVCIPIKRLNFDTTGRKYMWSMQLDTALYQPNARIPHNLFATQIYNWIVWYHYCGFKTVFTFKIHVWKILINKIQWHIWNANNLECKYPNKIVWIWNETFPKFSTFSFCCSSIGIISVLSGNSKALDRSNCCPWRLQALLNDIYIWNMYPLLKKSEALSISLIEAETKWTAFRRRHFQVHFLEWKCLNSG